MTEGTIWKRIVVFAVPLFLGNLFQQLYNTADSLIVGNFLGSSALAAVVSSGSLIFLMVGFFNGIFIGAGVVIAKYYGAGDDKKVHQAVHTTVALGIVSGAALTVIGLILAPQMLIWMGTPKDVLPNSILYFRTYFCGSLGFVLYNSFVGILQSSGDSRNPLKYLIVSSIVNICLDLLFIGVFRMGVGSAALATIISQFVSAILCLGRLMRSHDSYRVTLKEIRFHKSMLKQIIKNGLPMGIQNSIISAANVVVQSNINVFGKMAVAGCGTYSKIEGFGFLPISCFSMALTTFTSQNLGAGKKDRAKSGAKFGIICSVAFAEIIGIIIYISIPVLAAGFNNNPEVIRFATMQARTEVLFYFLVAFSHCMAGILRGGGKSTVPMLVMFLCWCVIRITYITTILRFIPHIQVIFWAYPLTWCLSSVTFLLYYFKSNWLEKYHF